MLSGQFGERLHLVERALAAQRVLQVVVDQYLGGRRDLTAQVVEIDGEPRRCLHVSVRLAETAEVLDLALVDRVARRRVQHAVTRVHHDLEELADDRLTTRLHGDVVGQIGKPAAHGHVVGQRLTQRSDPGRGAIPGLAVGDRPVHRLDHVGRCRQVDVT